MLLVGGSYSHAVFDNILHPFYLIMHNTQCQEFLEYWTGLFLINGTFKPYIYLRGEQFCFFKVLDRKLHKGLLNQVFSSDFLVLGGKNPEFFRVKHLKSSSFSRTVYHLRFPFSYFLQYIHHCKLSL